VSEIQKYLDPLFRDARQVELRHQFNGRWTTGQYDNPDLLLRDARTLAGQGNLYTSINRPYPFRPSNSMTGEPIRNDSVLRYARLLFDLDPVRPTGTASTDIELAHAKQQAEFLRKVLREWGWPEPLIAMSGNGYHLQYRVALPNDDETKGMLNAIYKGMKPEFSTDDVSFDSTVRNSGRICALYGSIKRKGPTTPDRPHRQSRVWIPRDWQQVSQKAVEAVAEFYTQQQRKVIVAPRITAPIIGSGDYHTLDVVSWFQAHGYYKHHAEDHKHYVKCPWHAEHSTPDNPQGSDSLIFETTGNDWPGYFCHHDHCDGRGIRDVIQLLGDADAFCKVVYLKEVSNA